MKKVSLITVSFNCEKTISDTIRSVLKQDYPHIEYIIKDAGSKDGTADVVKSFGDRVSTFIVQKDAGMYDGLNQAIDVAQGEIIGLIHSDDFYIHAHVISDVVALFEKENCDAVYADLYYVDKDDTDKVVRKWKSGSYKHGMFLNGWMPPHPTFFVKKEVYEKYGKFNLLLRSAADYEFMLRIMHKNKIKVSYLADFIVKMRTGGKSNVSLANRLFANKEDRMAWKINGLTPRFYTLFWKPIRKIFQYL